MSNEEKSWEKPWSTQEIIDNASNWSLAGDAAVLKSLESFAENLFNKTSETNQNLDNLLNNLNKASLRLDIVKNEFLSLHNTQFIESRVYDDDETVSPEAEPETPIKNDEKDKENDLADIVMRGIELMDKYYEKVEVSASDSEDDESPNYILRPIDRYVDRPLPYVIGSEQWHKKWHVGLKDSSSEDEIEKLSEKYSDTDSESDLPISNRINIRGMSETSSEIDLKTNVKHPVANSTFNDSAKEINMFEDSSSENDHSVPVQAPISSNNFAEQLAEKLGNVINQQLSQNEEVNKRPIQKLSGQNKFQSNIFSDVPPPIDSDDDKNIFSGGGGLFDDLDDDLDSFWGDKSNIKDNNSENTPISNSKSFFKDDDDNFVKTPQNVQSSNLFDNDMSDDDDGLFKTEKKVSMDGDSLKKKPIGGVKMPAVGDIFSNNTVGNLLKKTRLPSSDTSEEDSEKITENQPKIMEKRPDIPEVIPGLVETNRIEEIPKDKTKKLSLFDDNNIFEDDDLFSNLTTKKFTSSLFDDDSHNKGGLFDDFDAISQDKTKEKPSIFDDSPVFEKSDEFLPEIEKKRSDEVDTALNREEVIEKPPKITPVVTLFDDTVPPDLDEDWDTKSENNLFEDIESVNFDSNAGYEGRRSSLFDNEPPSLFAHDSESGIVKDGSSRGETHDGSSFYPALSSSRRLSSDIFSEEQSNDSIFLTKNKSDLTTTVSGMEIIHEVSLEQTKIDLTPSGNLEDLFEGEESDLSKEIQSKINRDTPKVDSGEQKSAKPPVFPRNVTKDGDKDETKIKTVSPGKLKHNLKINVAALMPGAAPPRKEIIKSRSLDAMSPERQPKDSLLPSSSEANIPSGSTFDQAIENVETLRSITKDRARISIKRRPSTRRGRKEQILRNSVQELPQNDSDTQEEAAINTNLIEKDLDSEENLSKTANLFDDVKNTQISIFDDEHRPNTNEEALKTDEKPKSVVQVVEKKEKPNLSLFEDDFITKEVISEEPTLKQEIKKPKKLNRSLFDSPDSDDDLFKKIDPFPKETKPISKIATSDLFAEDDGLFGSRKPPIKTVPEPLKSDPFADEDYDDIFSSKKLPQKSDLSKRSLFDDDDDDDIFGSGSMGKTLKISGHSVSEKRAVKVKKLDATEMLDDPLDALKK